MTDEDLVEILLNGDVNLEVIVSAAERIGQLADEVNYLRNFDDYFRSACGFKRDGRYSKDCLDDFIANITTQGPSSVPFEHFIQLVEKCNDLQTKLTKHLDQNTNKGITK